MDHAGGTADFRPLPDGASRGARSGGSGARSQPSATCAECRNHRLRGTRSPRPQREVFGHRGHHLPRCDRVLPRNLRCSLHLRRSAITPATGTRRASRPDGTARTHRSRMTGRRPTRAVRRPQRQVKTRLQPEALFTDLRHPTSEQQAGATHAARGMDNHREPFGVGEVAKTINTVDTQLR